MARLTLMGQLREGQLVRGTYEVERLTGEGASPKSTEPVIAGRQAMKVFKTVAGASRL